MNRQDILAASAFETSSSEVLAGLMAERFSCRKFIPRPVPEKQLKRVFELAQLTASWCNAQPWQLHVTSGASTKRFGEALFAAAQEDALKANNPEVRASTARRSDIAMPSQYTGPRKERRRAQGRQLYQSLGVLGDREASTRFTMENFRFFGAPHAAIFTSHQELDTYGVLDTGGYLSNLMLIMRSVGIDSIPQAALALYGDLVRDFFSIPTDQLIVCGLSFGYADKDFVAGDHRTDRAELSEVVTWHD